MYSQLLDTSSVHDYKPTNIQLQQTEKYLFLDTSQTNLDTSLNLFYNYYPTYQNAFPFIDLGLEATPVLALSKSNNQQLKLRLGADHMNPYFYDEKIHIYQTDKPFTRLNYSQGANEMPINCCYSCSTNFKTTFIWSRLPKNKKIKIFIFPILKISREFVWVIYSIPSFIQAIILQTENTKW
jgi:hypothetical protein